MIINFLGTSHGYAEKNRFTSTTVVEANNKYYLIDAGGPVEYLMVNNDMDYDKIRGIFITHMHNDHVGGLSTVIEPMLRYRYNDKSECFFPSKEGLFGFVEWLKILCVNEDDLRRIVKLSVTDSGVIFDDGNVKVAAKRNCHMDKGGDSFSYIFEADGKKVFFTGDMAQEFEEYTELLGDDHYDLVVCEGAHCPLKRSAERLKKTNTDRMIFNHVYFESVEGHEEILKEFPFSAEVSYDGLKVEL